MRITTLASSSSGNCTLVSSGGEHILIDAGISFKRIKIALAQLGIEPCELSAVLVTHSHGDHVGGLATFTKRAPTKIIATERTHAAISPAIAAGTALIEAKPGESVAVGSIDVRAFSTSHDAPGSVGFSVTCGSKRLVFATDLGIVTEEVMDAARGADGAVIESNHDAQMLKYGYYPPSLKRRIMSDTGHLSNTAGAAFAVALAKAGAKKIILAHLSHENNTPELAYGCTYEKLQKAGAVVGGDVELIVAPRGDLSIPIEL